MGKYCKIFSVFFLLLFCIGVKASLRGSYKDNAVVFHKQVFPACSITLRYSAPNLPQSNIVQIRHRSAEENENMVLSPNHGLVVEITCHDSPPEYLSKWTSYIQFILEDLPNDQAIPSSLSLRAPPFSC